MLPDPSQDKVHDIAEERPQQRKDCHDCSQNPPAARDRLARRILSMLRAESALQRREITPLPRWSKVKTRPVAAGWLGPHLADRCLPDSRLQVPRLIRVNSSPGVLRLGSAVLFSINL
jgi:hypothetical protein